MCIGWLRLRKYSYIYRVIYLIVIKMLKVVAFMKQVAKGLQMGGNFGTAHVYRSSLNAIIAYRGKGDFTFHEVTPEWLKGFEIHLRGRGCSWNTVSTYLRTFRAVYNRAGRLSWGCLCYRICFVLYIPAPVRTVSVHWIPKTYRKYSPNCRSRPL